jgi:uncharacterized integral membrane protein
MSYKSHITSRKNPNGAKIINEQRKKHKESIEKIHTNNKAKTSAERNANALAFKKGLNSAFTTGEANEEKKIKAKKEPKTAFIVIGIIVAIIVVVIVTQTVLKTGFSNPPDLNTYVPTILILIILLYICCKW